QLLPRKLSCLATAPEYFCILVIQTQAPSPPSPETASIYRPQIGRPPRSLMRPRVIVSARLRRDNFWKRAFLSVRREFSCEIFFRSPPASLCRADSQEF